LGASAAAWAPTGRKSGVIRSQLCDVAAIERNLGSVRTSALFDEGKSMPIGQAIAYARRPLYAKTTSGTGSGTLTRAERAVATLAASGLTNPQIADRLWISRNTVEHRLTRIFAKLGIASRAHLAKELVATSAGAPAGAEP
jgi:DNA-binding CsgD family transcriptional regulator